MSLHDHLDGGLRPATIVEIAAANGHRLPTTDPEELGAWFRDAADSGTLVRYLETFDHTVAVMQDAESLARVATEAVLDLAADGVVYGELRYAPEQHLQGGLSLDEVVVAVEEGMRRGEQLAAEAGTPIRVGTLVTAMRHADRGLEIAELALRHRDAGVVGFDIAGAEIGFPPSNHLAAFDRLHAENFPVTIHAGEAFGLPSIADAVHPAVPNASGTGSGSSRTSNSGRDATGSACPWRSSAASRPGSATAGSSWNSARPPTCRRGPRPASRTTPSPCSRTSGSRSA